MRYVTALLQFLEHTAHIVLFCFVLFCFVLLRSDEMRWDGEGERAHAGMGLDGVWYGVAVAVWSRT